MEQEKQEQYSNKDFCHFKVALKKTWARLNYKKITTVDL